MPAFHRISYNQSVSLVYAVKMAQSNSGAALKGLNIIQLSFFSPVCNFADYCITAGTIMLVVYILFFNNESDKKISRAE